MAEGILFSVAELMIETLGSAAVKEIGLLWRVDKEFEKLQRTLSTIKAVLLDAEKKKAHNNQIKDWLERLEDVVDEADVLLDEVATEGLRRQLMPGKNKMSKEVRTFFSSSNQVVFRVKMAHRVTDIRETLDEIAANGAHLHLEVSSEEAKATSRVRETHSFVIEDDVVGRVKDKVVVLKLLLNHENGIHDQERLSILPIVGMGGLGKTTLAQLVFNDEQVKLYFDLRIWVCVSDDFENFLLLRKIVKTISNETAVENLETMEQLQTKLRSEMSKKRYLLVLDDVWNEDHHKWKKIHDLLTNCGELGSWIILTSRSKKVAEVMGTLPPHCLGALGTEDSWSLFKKRAFGKRQLEPTNSATNVDIAEKIMKKLCGGVPLALSMIGSMLYFSDPEKDWPSFLEKDLSDVVPQEENHIMNTLRLSYDYLPPHLKRCFVFCSLFPKDHKIEIKTLIRLWMAQGLITSSKQSQDDLEDIGHKYFMDLYCRSFFQEVEGDEVNEVKTCKMHDLVHDLAVEVAGKKYATLASNEESVSARVHHLSFSFDLFFLKDIPISLPQAKGLQTILFPIRCDWHKMEGDLSVNKGIYKAVVPNFVFLRFLDLRDFGIENLPSSIGKLKLLRYLDLSGNSLKTLPTSITKLVNLQTLKLNENYSLRELPRDVDKLVKLRHLELTRCDSLTLYPRGLSQLTNLQTLYPFQVTLGQGRGMFDVLMRLNNLRGELKITGLRDEIETKDANLKGKEHLHSLCLEWSWAYRWVHIDERERIWGASPSTDKVRENVLKGLQPHPNLKVLTLYGYDGATLPNNWLSSLTHLVALKLDKCVRCHKLSSLDKLHSLKKIELRSLISLEFITTDVDGDSHLTTTASPAVPTPTLPSLQQLMLIKLPNFIGWERPNLYFPCLTMLTIEKCPRLSSIPAYPNTCLMSSNQNNIFGGNMTTKPEEASSSFSTTRCRSRLLKRRGRS